MPTRYEVLRARRLRRDMTDVEAKLWSHLRRGQLGGHRFRRQAPIGPYVVDFVCLAARLVIEVDGPCHEDRRTRDARRDRWFEAEGYRVLRFSSDGVFWDCAAVLEAIFWELEKGPPPPRRGG